MSSREEELVARLLLERQELIDEYFRDKRWKELLALVRFARRDVSPELASTDPALYRTLRDQITRFYLRGGGAFSVEKLEKISAPWSLAPRGSNLLADVRPQAGTLATQSLPVPLGIGNGRTSSWMNMRISLEITSPGSHRGTRPASRTSACA